MVEVQACKVDKKSAPAYFCVCVCGESKTPFWKLFGAATTSSITGRILNLCGTIKHLMVTQLIMLRLLTPFMRFCDSTKCTQESFPAHSF